MIDKSAIFSETREYRYVLSRIWNRRIGYCLFNCLNPSIANENIDDPTVGRCIRFAESFHCGGMVMVNMFAYCSTKSGALLSVRDPVGPENDFYIKKMADGAKIVIAGWGVHKLVKVRAKQVIPLLKNPQYLALAKNGEPRHPLYLKKTLRPKPFGKDLQREIGNSDG